MSLAWQVRLELWRYRRPFIIARGVLEAAGNLVVEVSEGGQCGRGEAEPHESDRARWDAALVEAQGFLADAGAGLTRTALAAMLPPGAIRNAIDCALWDFEAKRHGGGAAALAGISLPPSLPITGTVSFDAPGVMAEEAREKAPHASIVKIKLGEPGDGDAARVQAVRAAVPQARLIVDANEGWDLATLTRLAPELAQIGVEMIEQPLPAGEDAAIAQAASPVVLCADESVTDTASLAHLPPGYGMINIKLDKCGGLTEGLLLARAAQARGLDFMVGSNGGTSLAAAPAYLLAATGARYADIDSPLLLAEDREPGMRFANGMAHAPLPELWG
jgi:L-alanine-DL-glutamate epimerase-like enolase superfamily enzyme